MLFSHSSVSPVSLPTGDVTFEGEWSSRRRSRFGAHVGFKTAFLPTSGSPVRLPTGDVTFEGEWSRDLVSWVPTVRGQEEVIPGADFARRLRVRNAIRFSRP